MKKIFLTFFLLVGSFVFAAGNIDSSCKYAWSGSTGWINFGCDNCNVQVLDNKITGYVWSENYGWINLAPSNGGIINDGQGNLSGYAWGESLGWIDFSNAKIDPNTGNFNGYALILIYNTSTDEMKKIVFQGNNFCLKTTWRPSSGSGSGYFSSGHEEEEKSESFDQNIFQTLLNLINKFSSTSTKITKKEKIIKPPVKIVEKVIEEKMPFPFTGGLKITYTQKNLDLSLFFNICKMDIKSKLIEQHDDTVELIEKKNLIDNLNIQILILPFLLMIILYVVFIFIYK